MRRGATMLVLIPALTLVSPLASACSGLHVLETMKSVEQSARWGAAACGLIVLASLFFRAWIALAANIFLFAFHPAWTMSPYHGDCGGTQAGATLLVVILSLSTFGWDFLRRLRDRYPHMPEIDE